MYTCTYTPPILPCKKYSKLLDSTSHIYNLQHNGENDKNTRTTSRSYKTCKGQGNCYTKIMMNGYTHMIDKKLGCLSIHTNIAEFRYKAAEFSDTKEMHVQTKRER